VITEATRRSTATSFDLIKIRERQHPAVFGGLYRLFSLLFKHKREAQVRLKKIRVERERHTQASAART
jgi:hypothetical protein